MHSITSSPGGFAKAPPLVQALQLPEPLRSWSGTRQDYPRKATVTALFEEIANRRPEAVALIQGHTEISYQQLNTRANRLAHRLRRAGVKPETMVGCCVERSIEMIVALLGVLKAGGAYVPLDPDYPKARLDFILQDTGNPLIVTSKSLASTLFSEYSERIVAVDDAQGLSFRDDENPQPGTRATSLAYVMYTSGSTGKPKGVMVEHRGIVRLVRGTDYCQFGADEVFLQFAPASFDASTFEIWGALLNGSRLVLMPAESSSLDDIVRAVRQHGVTTLWLTAGLFHLMVEEHPEGLRNVKQLLAGGDVLSPHHVRRFLESAQNATLINGYGPTENTTFTCCHRMRAGEPLGETVPIGKPISNGRVYLLDENGIPVAPGEIGELYAAGDGMARGYLNDPETTADRFLVDPFADEPHQRMYRTGDLARWRADGTIEFLGRIDNQVKILGHRIEPAEIESVLQQHEQIKQVCVVARVEADGAKRLAAFYVPSDLGPSSEELRSYLASRLPQHMIPAFFLPLASLPLTNHGKVDRAALGRMDVNPKQAIPQAEVAGNQIERTLLELWQRILKVPTVGLDDNFFDLGGDSLLLVAVHSNLQKTLKTEIALTDLFEFATVRKLAQHLGNTESVTTSLADVQDRAQQQRASFKRFRGRRPGGDS